MDFLDAFVQWPLAARLAAAGVLGVTLGPLVNLAVYTLAWNRRAISPWSAPPPGALPRRWTDRLPIVGWLGLARESTIHGSGHWVRPMLVEVLCGCLFAGLYWWEAVRFETTLAIAGLAEPPPLGAFATSNILLLVHVQLAGHLLLVLLMLAASLIDIDEKTIPDAITVPGTLLAMLLATVYPWSLPTEGVYAPIGGAPELTFLHVASPNPWPEMLAAYPSWPSLTIGLASWSLWCFGLLPRRWNTSRGIKVAWRVFCHRLQKDFSTRWIGLLWLIGAMAVGLVWRKGAVHWVGLLSSLVGLAAAVALVWSIRLIATYCLGREAMGFGDVTLLGMIGALVGWQTSIVVFFLAPLAAVAIGVVRFILKRDREIPFGPFLCLAAFAILVGWSRVWPPMSERFALGWLIPAVILGGLVLLPVLLFPVHWLATLLRGKETPPGGRGRD